MISNYADVSTTFDSMRFVHRSYILAYIQAIVPCRLLHRTGFFTAFDLLAMTWWAYFRLRGNAPYMFRTLEFLRFTHETYSDLWCPQWRLGNQR